MQVAGGGVTGDAGQKSMLSEQRLKVAGALGNPLGRHADVLDDERGSGRAQAADQSMQSLSHPPAQLNLLPIPAELNRANRLVGGEDPPRLGEALLQLILRARAELDQEHGGVRGSSFHCSGAPTML